MARIAFFSEKLPPDRDPIAEFSYDLMCSLADQQHEIQVMSTYRIGDELPPRHPRVEVLRPFQKWSWLEIPKALPSLLEFQPDILHFIQPRAESLEGFTNAMSAIPGLSAILGRPAIIGSYYDLRKSALGPHKTILLACHAATVMNRLQKDLLEEFYSKVDRKPEISILPVPTAINRYDQSAVKEEAIDSSDEKNGANLTDSAIRAPSALREFLETSDQVIFVPGDIDQHENLEALFAALHLVLKQNQSVRCVLGGDWASVPRPRRRSLMRKFEFDESGARILLAGFLDNVAERFCFEKASVVFIASLPPESLSLMRIIREALKCSSPLVLAPRQAELTPFSWKNREHAFITEDHLFAEQSDHPTSERDVAAWSSILTEALSSIEVLNSMRMRLPEFTRLEVSDQPGNVMSRIYARLIGNRYESGI